MENHRIRTVKRIRTVVDLRKGRNRWLIMHDVLKVMQEDEVNKTHIMRRADLDWRNFKRYFDFLLEKKYIHRTADGRYMLNDNGRQLLEKLKDINGMLSEWYVKCIFPFNLGILLIRLMMADAADVAMITD